MTEWFVYIIQTTDNRLYTGITTDLERRFSEHKEGIKGAKFFSSTAPKKIVFSESHPDRASATRREIEIKKMSRTTKLALIAPA